METTNSGEKYTQQWYKETIETIKQAARVYENTPDQPLMDDYSYDMLLREVEEAERLNPTWGSEDSVTKTVAAGVNTSGDVIHSAPMLSLDKAFTEEELKDWEAKLTRALGRKVTEFVIEPKLDGLALSARYVDGKLQMLLLRGSGTAGEDVTHNAKLITGLPSTLNENVTIEIRGECFMTDDDFAKANELRVDNGKIPFVNPRNGAAGAVRAKDRLYDIPLNFLAYSVLGHDEKDHSEAMDYLHSLGVSTTNQSKAPMVKASNITEIIKAIEDLGTKRGRLGFDIDGAVIKANKATDRDEAGSTSRAPRWAVAWKYPPDTRKTILKDIILQVGRTGAIAPVAVLEPVYVGGAVNGRGTLHNATEIGRKDLRIGDAVWIRRAGEVIPEIIAVHLPDRPEGLKSWEPPTKCPRCEGGLNKSQKVWRCLKGRECGLAESVYYFGHKDCMYIKTLGKKLAAQLVEEKLVNDIGDVYYQDYDKIKNLERMGAKSADNFFDELEKAKSQPLSHVFASLGVRLTGRRMSKTLADHFGSMEAIENATFEELTEIDGVGDARAVSIMAGVAELKPVIQKLKDAGVNMVEPGFGEVDDSIGEKPFRNTDGTPKSIVITGSIPGLGRDAAKAELVRLGGKESSSVSKKTDLVIVGESPGSKATKAEQLGIKIMTGQEYAQLVKDN